MQKKISVIIPAYNEAAGLENFCIQLIKKIGTLDTYQWEVIIINDGSNDATREVITTLTQKYSLIKGINFSRNFGKEIALSAGLQYAQGDAAITIDADGQHPIDRLDDFLQAREQGYAIVYNRRPEINGATLKKKVTSRLFYALFNKISEFKLEAQTTDYRLLDRKVIDIFLQFTEKNRLYRGLIDRIGFRKKALVFDALPNTRQATYNYNKLTKLAIDSITGFSVWPLKFVGYLGVIIVLLSCGGLMTIIIDKLMRNYFGFTNLGLFVLINTLLVGIMMIALGLIALYIAQIHEEVKGRPLFIVQETLNV